MGAASAWMYRTLAGIRVDPAQPAFRHVLIRPCFVDGLEWVKASYDSQRGEIRSAWERNGDEATLTVQIPANVTATVILPSEAVKAIDGDGKNIPESESDDSASYRIGSGTSRFSCRVTK